MESEGEIVYLTNGWLEDSEASSTTSSVTTNTAAGSYTIWTTPYYGWTNYGYEPKIRMTLTEIEHIRKLCKSDQRLKATMQKLTPYITVEVDF